MAPPGVEVIVNPVAGGGRARRLTPQLTDVLRDLGVEFDLKVSENPGQPEQLARDAASAGVRIVAAVGGDGLAGAVANGLAGTQTALAVIPAGTGNDFARSLGLGRRAALPAARLLARPSIRAIDIGKVVTPNGERYFVNVAGAGFDSQVNETANRMHARIPGSVKYMTAVLGTLVRFVPSRFRVTVGATTRDVEAMMVAVGNGKSYGGGMRVTPDASLTDGLLDVCIVEAMRKSEFVWAFPRVFRGAHISHPRVSMLRGRTVEVDSDRPSKVFADGELVGDLPARFEAVHEGLQVVRP